MSPGICIHHLKNKYMGWRGGSVCKVLIIQIWGSTFNPQNPVKGRLDGL